MNNRQDSAKKIGKTKSTSNLGLSSKSASNLGLSSKTPDNVDKLRKELEASHHLVSSLRARVEQKEQIAALACNNIKVRNMLIHCLKQAALFLLLRNYIWYQIYVLIKTKLEKSWKVGRYKFQDIVSTAWMFVCLARL